MIIHVEWYIHLPRCDHAIPLWVCRIFWDSCQTWWAPAATIGWLLYLFSGCSWCLLEKSSRPCKLVPFNLYLTGSMMLGLLHDADMFCLQHSKITPAVKRPCGSLTSTDDVGISVSIWYPFTLLKDLYRFVRIVGSSCTPARKPWR